MWPPLRFVMGTRSVGLHVYFLRNGSFILNSYKNPVARKEGFLRARLTRIFQTPHIFIIEISVQVAPVLLNVAFNGREENRKASLSRNHLRITVSLKATSKSMPLKKE